MADSAQAVTAAHVREHLDTIPGISLPAAITDPRIDVWAKRKTALVLSRRGVSSLPLSGSQERDIIDDAVLALTLIEAQRHIHRGNQGIMEALLEEEKLLLRTLEEAKKSAPKASHWAAGVASE